MPPRFPTVKATSTVWPLAPVSPGRSKPSGPILIASHSATLTLQVRTDRAVSNVSASTHGHPDRCRPKQVAVSLRDFGKVVVLTGPRRQLDVPVAAVRTRVDEIAVLKQFHRGIAAVVSITNLHEHVVEGLTPTLGKEVEAMELAGYAPFDEELAEDWGVQTSSAGTASHAFDLPSGSYDVRITYFDGPVGQSEIKLSIAGEAKASFKMDEDCNCWRWRRFENITINTGDRVTLNGKADRDDLARLDFIEFIK